MPLIGMNIPILIILAVIAFPFLPHFGPLSF